MHDVKRMRLVMLVLGGLGGACAPEVKVTHSPIIATAAETVTYTAVVTNTGGDPYEVRIYNNGGLVHTCNSTTPCVYTGGPYPGFVDWVVSYRAEVWSGGSLQDADPEGPVSYSDYWFAITNTSYAWFLPYIPARWAGDTADKEDLFFHMASDYVDAGKSFGTFVGHVEDKMYDVYGQQAIIKDHLREFNFWVYSQQGVAGDCGTVDAQVEVDAPWRDDDAVLHWENFQDCTNAGRSHFSAEGSNTKAFLHESGHAVLGLSDEYCGPTGYFQPAVEPNIWDLDADCRAEQSGKGRDPNACYEFCDRSGGWQGIQQGTTVMTTGNVGDAWYTEAEEHVKWYLDSLM